MSSRWPLSRNGAGLDRLARGALGVGEPIASERDAGGRHRLQRAQPQLGDLAAAIAAPTAPRRRPGSRRRRSPRTLRRRSTRRSGSPAASAASARSAASTAASRSTHAPAGSTSSSSRRPRRTSAPTRAPHARQQRAERLARIGGQALRPQQLDQLVAPDRAAAVDDQIGEGQAPLAPGQDRLAARQLDAERAAEPDRRGVIRPHGPSIAGFAQGFSRVLARRLASTTTTEVIAMPDYAKDVLVDTQWVAGPPRRRLDPDRRGRREPGALRRGPHPRRDRLRLAEGPAGPGQARLPRARGRSASCSARAASPTTTRSCSTATATTGSPPTPTGT